MFGENLLCSSEYGNTRAGEITSYIHSAFAHEIMLGRVHDYSVLDLGFGYGDILEFFRYQGWNIFGVDNDLKCFDYIQVSTPNEGMLFYADILDWITSKDRGTYAVTVCTSVLPYFALEQQDTILSWMSEHSAFSIIEMQSGMDGPASKHDLDGQEEVAEYLQTYYKSVTRIGSTWVKGGRYMRALFLCESREVAF